LPNGFLHRAFRLLGTTFDPILVHLLHPSKLRLVHKPPRERVTLVAPPFVHAHEQVTKSGPKIIEFTMTVEEKPIVIDDAGTTIPGLTYNGSIPGPLMVVHEGDYVELTLVNPATNIRSRTDQ
jgi:FtsP/CotA-like multicopper oxidase with cupredoxin domain